jgi:hypothetical protein
MKRESVKFVSFALVLVMIAIGLTMLSQWMWPAP